MLRCSRQWSWCSISQDPFNVITFQPLTQVHNEVWRSGWVLLECNCVNVVVGSVYGNGGDENWSEWASTVNNELNEELDSPDEQRRQQPDRWTDECSHSMNGWNFNCNFAVNVLMKYNTNFFILLWLLLLNCRCCYC